MAEQKGITMTILGVVAIIAVVGLVLLFTKTGTDATGEVSGNQYTYGAGGNVDARVDKCSVMRQCNGQYDAAFAGTVNKGGQIFNVCKCPYEAGETLYPATT